jgi:hypothetical protein
MGELFSDVGIAGHAGNLARAESAHNREGTEPPPDRSNAPAPPPRCAQGPCCPKWVACAVALWDDVFDVYAIGEFDQTHLYIVGLCQTTSSGHHAFKPRLIGGDERSIATVC